MSGSVSVDRCVYGRSLTSNCSGVLQRLAGSEGMGEYTRPLGSSEPQGLWSSGWRGSSGRGGVMGDNGRSRWSEGAGVISSMYLARRFLNGAFRSVWKKSQVGVMRFS